MVKRLSARGIDFMLMDWRLYPDHCDIQWTLDGGVVDGFIRYGSRTVPLAEVTSIFMRQIELCDLLSVVADALPIRFVNPIPSFGSNSSKPYQQQIIREHGFRVPKTLVTTIPEEVERFYEECGGHVICKSVSDQMSVVRKVTSEDLGRAGNVRWSPTQFQEFVPGVETRVHTVGDRVFATEISSTAVDYRYAGREGKARGMRPVRLPDDVEERCLSLSADLGLVLGGVDLRCHPDGEYYCFEVNPMPGFTFFEHVTRQRMGDALIDLMLQDFEPAEGATPFQMQRI